MRPTEIHRTEIYKNRAKLKLAGIEYLAEFSSFYIDSWDDYIKQPCAFQHTNDFSPACAQYLVYFLELQTTQDMDKRRIPDQNILNEISLINAWYDCCILTPKTLASIYI